MIGQWAFIWENLPRLLFGFPEQQPGGLCLSVLLALVAVIVGFGLGNVVALGSRSAHRWLRWLCRGYIELIRGVPLLVLVLLVYQIGGNPRVGLELCPLTAALIALTLYSSVYQAEITRAGFNAMPPQLIEMTRVLGGSRWQSYWSVQLRHLIRTMLPAYVGQAISLFKDTSVVLIIGVSDLMMVARVVLGSDVTNAPYWVALYMTVGLLYFFVAFGLSMAARRWELRNQSGELLHSLVNY